MQRALIVVGVAMALTLMWSVGSVQVQAKSPKKKDLILISADDAKFKDVVPGVAKAVLWGNHDAVPKRLGARTSTRTFSCVGCCGMVL